jgi:hypothetical protein
MYRAPVQMGTRSSAQGGMGVGSRGPQWYSADAPDGSHARALEQPITQLTERGYELRARPAVPEHGVPIALVVAISPISKMK